MRNGGRAAGKPLNLIAYAFPMIVVFYNFRVFSVAGRVVTLSDLVIGAVTAYYLLNTRFSAKLTAAFAGFCIVLPIISAMVGFDYVESVKSIAQLALYSSFVIVLANNESIDYSAMKACIKNLALFLGLYGILQFLVIGVAGILEVGVAYPFGAFTAFNRGMLALMDAPAHWRSNSFFLEPSTFGLFMILVLFGESEDFRYALWEKIVFLLAILCTKSSIAFVGLMGCVFVSLFGRNGAMRRWMAPAIAGIALLPILFAPVFARVYTEMSIVGSSGFSRIVQPSYLVAYSLPRFPLGLGIGVSDRYFSENIGAVGRALGVDAGPFASIDNNLAQVIVSFGFLSILYFALLGYVISKIMKKSYPLATLFVLFHLGTGTLFVGVNWIFMMAFYVLARDSGETRSVDVQAAGTAVNGASA